MAGARAIRAVALTAVTTAVVVATILVGRPVGVSTASALSALAPPGTPHARTAAALPTIATLFDSATATTHFCTASVVDSPRGNVLITAGHCIRGSARGWTVAPGFHNGITPYGRWRVTGVYMDPGWIAKQDSRRDYAFLTVAPRLIDGRWTEIQSVTGANRLGSLPRSGERITVPAIPRGSKNGPLT